MPRTVTLSLTPRAASPDLPAGLEVEAVIAGADGPLELGLDRLSPWLDRARDTVTDLTARDARGDLGVVPSGNREGGQYQAWTARRPTAGPIHLRCFMPSALPHPERRGPHIDLQAVDGGVSGSFAGSLLAPSGPLHLTVRWHLPPGQRAISSLGDGDLDADGAQATLGNTLFVAGPVRTMPAVLPSNGFGTALLGRTAMNLDVAKRWYAKAFVAERDAFHAPARTRFRVLVRNYDGGPIASGCATKGAFL